MSQSQFFPVELLQKIIRHVPRISIYQCMYVCKSWSTAAALLFYEELTLEEEKIISLEAIIKNNSQYHPVLKVGKLVKKLTITNDEGDYIQEHTPINDISSIFPGLRTIDISCYSNSLHYFWKIREIEEMAAKLKGIRQIINYRYSAVPFKMSHREDKLEATVYRSLCEQHHDSITHLTFSDHCIVHWINSIKNYHNLTHLTIQNNFAIRDLFSKEELYMPIFLSRCPKMISFTLLNSFLIPDDYEEVTFRIREICTNVEFHERSIRRERLLVISDPEIPSHPINKNLTKLFLTFPSITTAQMEYIISYVPSSQLDIFELKLTRITVHDWLDESCESTVTKFSHHLSQVKNLLFIMSTMNQIIEIERMGPEFLRKMERLHRFIKTLKGSRQIQKSHTKLNVFYKYIPIHKFVNFSFQIENNKSMYFEYVIQRDNFLTVNENNISSPFLMTMRDIIMDGESKDLDVITAQWEASNLMKYALANFHDIHNLRIYSHRLQQPESDLDRNFVIKYSRINGVTSVHVRRLIDMYDETFRIYNEITPNINILTLENCWLDNTDKKRTELGISSFKCVQLPIEDEEHFLLDLTDCRYLQKLQLSIPVESYENDKFLFKFTIADESINKKTKSFKFRNVGGKHVLEKKKLGHSILSNYRLVVNIKTLSKIEFSIYENE